MIIALGAVGHRRQQVAGEHRKGDELPHPLVDHGRAGQRRAQERPAQPMRAARAGMERSDCVASEATSSRGPSTRNIAIGAKRPKRETAGVSPERCRDGSTGSGADGPLEAARQR